MSNLDNGLKGPFRWYDSMDQQEFRKPWMKGKLDAFRLICPADRLLPFQVIKGAPSPFLFTSLGLYRTTDDAHWGNIEQHLNTNDLKGFTFANNTEYLVYYGNMAFLNGYKIPKGKYYLKAVSRTFAWYSEAFYVEDFDVNNNNCYTELEFCHCSPLAGILYGNEFQYKSRVYIDSDISKPEYKTEEEGFEDGNKVFIPTFQTQIKVYSLEVVVPEFMTDALNLMQLCDVVFVRSPYKPEARIRDVKVETKWENNGAFATLEMKFREEVITKDKCCTGQNLKDSYAKLYTTIVDCSIVINDYEHMLGGYFEGGVFKNFVAGDLVLIFDNQSQTSGGVYRVTWIANGSTLPVYTFQSAYQQEGKVVYTRRENKYWMYVASPFNLWSSKPVIKYVTISGGLLNQTRTMRAVIFPNTYSDLYYANMQISLPGQPVQPLVWQKASNPSLLQADAINTGFVVLGLTTLKRYKVSSLNHTLNFGYSDPR